MTYQIADVLPPQMKLETIETIFMRYQIAEFLKYQLKLRGPYKVFIIGTFDACMKNAESVKDEKKK